MDAKTVESTHNPAQPDAELPVADSSATQPRPVLRINRTPAEPVEGKGKGKSKKPVERVVDLNDPDLYINRELSHLQFNIRVLKQAQDESHPLLNRLMFLLIFSSNLDEFFEIRVAGLKRQIAFKREKASADGMAPAQVLAEISRICHATVEQQYQILNDTLIPALEAQQIRFVRRSDWTPAQAAWVEQYFRDEIQPVISPLGLDPSHPFPRLVNKTLNFIVELEGKDAFGRESGLAILPAPRSLPRLIRIPDELCDGGDNFVFLSSMVHAHAPELFPGMQVKGCYQFRLTRNADLAVDPEEVSDLASALRGELLSRRYGDAVRLEVADNCPDHLVQFLLDKFNLTEEEVYRVHGPVNLTRMMTVLDEVKRPDLVYPPITPGLPKVLHTSKNLFDTIKRGDILLHHPYQSFTPVVDLLRQAAQDPNVLAIKQTLYRTGAESEIVNALVEAARNNKEVTVVIELRARFDEAENLQLASRLQEAGAIVIYGVVDYKTHAKMVHIVRREGSKLRHYAHLGTGNYHPKTARLYTDYSLLTCDKELCEDVHKVFQQLTGMGKALRIKKLLHAPFTLHDQMLAFMKREAEHAAKGKKAHIIIKCNGLTEPKLIKGLYEASQAGVRIDLIIRGMCCLRPGIKGVSENIRVRSIVGRFLEHTRVFYFFNDCNPEVYCSSADWMERNMLNRVETCFPITSPKLASRVKKELDAYLEDNCQSWLLQSDGSYVQNQPAKEQPAISAQETLIAELANR